MFTIDTFPGRVRMSTEDLLLQIEEAVKNGETDFLINASGQHDIGGPLWNAEGKTLRFTVHNAGQRLGSMALPGTEIVAYGSVSADAGWLNSGGQITILGDAGDTAGHCASGGKIYIGGRAGTRTGSLMKHDPLYEEPELWILNGTGSFSFEFMGGGKAVVCGVGEEDRPSILGDRPCVGMVGGTIYIRGNAKGYPADIKCVPLDEQDKAFLADGLPKFLAAVEREELSDRLSDFSEWQKLRPLTFEERQPKQKTTIKNFREDVWFKGGLFADVATDDGIVLNTVTRGTYRLRVPRWDNAKFAAPCEFRCPCGIPTQQRNNLIRSGKLQEAVALVLKYTPFPATVCGTLCPNPCMEECSRVELDEAVNIGQLGLLNEEVELENPSINVADTGKKIAVIGGGVAGLSAAWQLRLKGHAVTVYDDGKTLGGKIEQAIPRFRIPHERFLKELANIEKSGIKFVAETKVDRPLFEKLQADFDAVIVATGGTKSRYFPWEGIENLTMGLDYLKAVNRSEKPHTGKRVVVIGAGNAGMDVATTLYDQGAAEVIAVDVMKPAAFDKEIARFEELGGKIIFPFFTAKIGKDGITSQDGTFIACDQAVVAIGEEPEIGFLPLEKGIKTFRNSWLVTDSEKQIMPGVFAAGDVIKPGRLTDAIGDGIKCAASVEKYLTGGSLAILDGNNAIAPTAEKPIIPQSRLTKAYFAKCRHCDIPAAAEEHKRCISCGTCRDCKMCYESCPEKAIVRTENPDGSSTYASDSTRCIGCGICAAVCPCGVWSIEENNESIKMYRTYEAS